MNQNVNTESGSLESAIIAASIATNGAEGLTLLILQEHLKGLCNMQINAIDEKLKSKHGGCLKGSCGEAVSTILQDLKDGGPMSQVIESTYGLSRLAR